MSALDVFKLSAGVYVIHAFYFHSEDASFFDEKNPHHTEAIDHYVVYNAGTRVLNLLPEVSISDFGRVLLMLTQLLLPSQIVVLHDEDIADLPNFRAMLLEKYHTRLNGSNGSFLRRVRRVWCQAGAHSSDSGSLLPLTHPHQLGFAQPGSIQESDGRAVGALPVRRAPHLPVKKRAVPVAKVDTLAVLEPTPAGATGGLGPISSKDAASDSSAPGSATLSDVASDELLTDMSVDGDSDGDSDGVSDGDVRSLRDSSSLLQDSLDSSDGDDEWVELPRRVYANLDPFSSEEEAQNFSDEDLPLRSRKKLKNPKTDVAGAH